MPTSTVVINGTTIEYLRKGRGRPLVLIHGVGGNCHVWEGTIHALQNHFELFAVSLPAYATKGRFGRYHNLRTYPSLLHQFIQKLDIQNPVLVGHSLGSLISLEYANRYPDKVRKLVMISSPLSDQSRKLPLTWRLALLLMLDSKILLKLAEQISENDHTVWIAQKFLGSQAHASDLRNDFKNWPAESIAQGFKDVFKMHFKTTIKKVNTPMLFIYGKFDGMVLRFNGTALYPLARNHTIVCLDGDHALPTTHSQKIAELIIKFVN